MIETPPESQATEAKAALTIPQMVFSSGSRYRDNPVCRKKVDGRYHDITWTEFSKELHLFARGLLTTGLQPGERVGIMAPNGPDWAWADVAIQACAGISVPIYHTESLANTLYILNDSGCRFLFSWSPLVASDIIKRFDEAPQLEKIILLRGRLEHPNVILIGDFITDHADTVEQEMKNRMDSLDADDLASIVYTSGTTGPHKGAMLSHRNFLSNVRDCIERFELGPEDTCLSFLPLSHVFERTCGYYLMLHQGVTIAYAENIDSVPTNLVEVRPTAMVSVPRLYEKMFARVMDKVVSGSWLKRTIFFKSLDLCKVRVKKELAHEPVPGWLKVITRIARSKVFVKLRVPLGERLRFFVSGGAPLAPNVAEFFLAAGIPIYEGYGLTETSPVIAANYVDHQRIGTVGKPLTNTRVEIADDGEIMVSGPGVFNGYWQNTEQTEASLDGEWFHTGDIGKLDDDGFLTITDRKKDLIVTAGGENISPQVLEKLFRTDKFIANAFVYGDHKPFLTALLIPNFENLSRYAEMKKIDFLDHCDLVNHQRILELMRRRVEKLQTGQPDFMQVRRFTLLSRDFGSESGELTQTLKIKRKVVAQKFHQIIESMYMAKDHGIHDHGYCIIDDNPNMEKPG